MNTPSAVVGKGSCDSQTIFLHRGRTSKRLSTFISVVGPHPVQAAFSFSPENPTDKSFEDWT